jgi:hypothetical protein
MLLIVTLFPLLYAILYIVGIIEYYFTTVLELDTHVDHGWNESRYLYSLLNYCFHMTENNK